MPELEVGTVVSCGFDVLQVTRAWFNENGIQCAEFKKIDEIPQEAA